MTFNLKSQRCTVRNSYHFKNLEIVSSSYFWTSCESEITFDGLNEQISPFCAIFKGITHTRAIDASVIFQGFTLLLISQATSKVIIKSVYLMRGILGGYPIPQ